MPKSNSQQESTPDAHIRPHLLGERSGGIAQGKDRANGPEGNRRELL